VVLVLFNLGGKFMRWRNVLVAIVSFCMSLGLPTPQAFAQIDTNDLSVVGGDVVHGYAIRFDMPMDVEESLPC
jgi:uncharacterized membrane protein YccF (DUF307 family)